MCQTIAIGYSVLNCKGEYKINADHNRSYGYSDISDNLYKNIKGVLYNDL